MSNQTYKIKNIDDVELVYSILKERYPDNKVIIEYISKEYILKIVDKKESVTTSKFRNSKETALIVSKLYISLMIFQSLISPNSTTL